jgi:hypothetical protein
MAVKSAPRKLLAAAAGFATMNVFCSPIACNLPIRELNPNHGGRTGAEANVVSDTNTVRDASNDAGIPDAKKD